MTPFQFAKLNCDCLQPDDSCLGITIADDLTLTRFKPENSPCSLSDSPIKRCPHFESCILPHKPDHPDSRRAASLQATWQQVSHAYRIETGYMKKNLRLCPQCRSEKIPPGRKLCDLCKAKNKRQTQADSNRKRNQELDYNSSSNSTVDNQ